MSARIVIRFDKQLLELHRTQDNKQTLCGQPIDDGTPWIDWGEDGTAHCPPCYGEAVQDEALFG